MNFNIRNFSDIKQGDPKLGELLEDILVRLGNVAEQVNANPEGLGPVPSQISALNVTSAGGIFDFQIQDNSPATRGVFYHIEASLTKNFSSPVLVYTGASRNHRTNLGNQTYYFRAFSQYLTGQPSPPVYFGGTTNPTAVIGGGAVTGPVPQPSAGSGTGRTNGLDGGVGFGHNPTRGQLLGP